VVETVERATGTGTEVEGLVRVLRWFVVGSAATFAIVLVSGLFLVWRYRPTETLAWAKVQQAESSADIADHIRVVHQIASGAVVLALLGTAIVTLMLAVRRRRVLLGVLGPGAVLAGLAGVVSGLLLPWDQLALWAVTVGEQIRGYGWLWDGSRMRYAIVGHAEISVDTFRRWFFVHTAVIPLLLLGLGALVWSATRSGAPSDRIRRPSRGTRR
jgi:quinol-cytochrome oxidoreductase complex cytochrome b subunit